MTELDQLATACVGASNCSFYFVSMNNVVQAVFISNQKDKAEEFYFYLKGKYPRASIDLEGKDGLLNPEKD